MAANDKQVAGTHYKNMPIEHWDLAAIFEWDSLQSRAIAYLMRWKEKGGLQDLEKALHTVQKYIEVEKLRKDGKLNLTLMRAAIAKLEAELVRDAQPVPEPDPPKPASDAVGKPARGFTSK